MQEACREKNKSQRDRGHNRMSYWTRLASLRRRDKNNPSGACSIYACLDQSAHSTSFFLLPLRLWLVVQTAYRLDWVPQCIRVLETLGNRLESHLNPLFWTELHRLIEMETRCSLVLPSLAVPVASLALFRLGQGPWPYISLTMPKLDIGDILRTSQ